MASVFERNGRWYLRVKDPAGKLVKIASKAQTKTEAKRLAGELERRYERQRLGLEPLEPQDGGGTLAELLTWWLETCSKGKPSHDWAKRSIRRHLLATDLAALQLTAVSAEKVEAFLLRKGQEELAPQTLNHLRAFLSRAFNAARKLGRYTGANPIETVGKRRIPKRLPEYLRAHEVPLLMKQLDRRWRPIFATAIYTGLRKGELRGLRKVDVDLRARLISVARSGERDTTKGGHADAIPIAAELVPYLEEAIKASPSELVFPAEDGGMMREDVKLAAVLRRALGRAGIVTGYLHVCRWCKVEGKQYGEKHPDQAPRRCPTCERKLWPKPQVRKIRFHDTRHTTGSLLTMAGANPAAVQKVLRHSDPKMTEIYSHLAPEYLRAEVDRLALGPKPAAGDEPRREASRAVAGSSVPNPSPRGAQKGEGPESGEEFPSKIQALLTERRTGFEPATPSLGSTTGERPAVVGSSQTRTVPRSRDSSQVQPSQPASGSARSSVPNPSPRLLSLEGGAEHLLNVRTVARRLGVSTATVYVLCERGELAHVRVSNAIRIAPADLAAFIARARS